MIILFFFPSFFLLLVSDDIFTLWSVCPVVLQPNNGMGWGAANMGGDPDFGMWMDDLGENQSSIDQDDVSSQLSTRRTS